MLTPTELRKDLVLVGGGHSHALALRMLAMCPIEGVRITLISPASHTPYSGMLPGLIAGHYSFADSHIDLPRLCQWAGVRFICAEVIGMDVENRGLQLRDRPSISYDLVSLDIGSQPELDSIPGARQFAIPVKPVATIWQRWQQVEQSLATARQSGVDNYRIGIVGGGAGSVELALSMAYRLSQTSTVSVQMDLWCGAAEILQGYNSRARRKIMGDLAGRGITVHLNARVSEVAATEMLFADGNRAAYDTLFWCTGAAAAPWIKASGLATDAQGFLAIDDTLQSITNPHVFGAGDIATSTIDPRPKAGVYAVRQAPTLAHNLQATLLGKTLQSFRPQRRFLSLLSLGSKSAVADRGMFAARGNWVWRWKDSIDRKFMRRFSDLPQVMSAGSLVHLPDHDPQKQAACGGCGAKVGANVLASALQDVSQAFPDHCRKANDDAVTVPLSGGPGPILQSVDVLRQIIPDPWLMGRIAANHALSDLYACGARPVSALAAVTLPFATGELLERDLKQLLSGALEEFRAVSCELSGGHSMQGSELQLGFTVNGVPINDGSLLHKLGGREGDALVLTKALGTGTLFAAHMQLAADGADINAAVENMLQSNARAAELALQFGAHACTDVTGFGLLGHLLEMLGEDWSAQLELSAIPFLSGAAECLARGIVSTAHADNVASHGQALSAAPALDSSRADIVFDPQTSGGLLIALAPDDAARLCEALAESDHPHAAIIGNMAAADQGGATVSLS